MGKDLTIVGLYPETPVISGDVWTMNDWYSRHPSIKPDRIFQLHWSWADLEQDGKRFKGDWKKKCRDSGAEIITLDEIEDLPSTFLEIDGLTKRFNKEDLSNSAAIMTGVAILEGYTSITLTSLHLMRAEFVYEIHGVLNMIKEARRSGIQISANYEQQWIDNIEKLDWDKIEFSKMAYWERE